MALPVELGVFAPGEDDPEAIDPPAVLADPYHGRTASAPGSWGTSGRTTVVRARTAQSFAEATRSTGAVGVLIASRFGQVLRLASHV